MSTISESVISSPTLEPAAAQQETALSGNNATSTIAAASTIAETGQLTAAPAPAFKGIAGKRRHKTHLQPLSLNGCFHFARRRGKGKSNPGNI